MQLSCVKIGLRSRILGYDNPFMSMEKQKNERRISRSRVAILRVLSKSLRPLSAVEIGERIHAFGQSFNKTTIYREMEKLKLDGEVKEFFLRNDCALYERNRAHHHHIVCVSCNVVRDIYACTVSNEEKRIAEQEHFDIIDHSFEIFGLCKKCR